MQRKLATILLLSCGFFNNVAALDPQEVSHSTFRHWAKHGSLDEIESYLTSVYSENSPVGENNFNHDNNQVIKILKILLETDSWNKTVFHHAAESGNAEVIKGITDLIFFDLFTDKAQPRIRKSDISNLLAKPDYRGRTALHLAAENGCIDCLRQILKLSPGILQETDDQGKNLLHFAAETGQFQVIRFFKNLLEGGHILNIDSLTGSTGKTPLMIASEHGHLEFVNWITNQFNADVKVPSGPQNMGATAVMMAAKIGHLPIVQALVRRDPTCLYQKDLTDKNILHYAVSSGQSGLVDSLIKFIDENDRRMKANLPLDTEMNQKSKLEEIIYGQDMHGNSLLHVASKYGYQTICQDLLKYPQLLYRLDNSGQLPLHTAIRIPTAEKSEILEYHTPLPLGKYVCLDLMLKSHARRVHAGHYAVYSDIVNLIDKFGFSSIFRAVEYGDPSIVLRLFKSGANATASQIDVDKHKNWRHLNLLHYAVYRGQTDLIGPLVKSGVSLSQKMSDGSTPLILAIKMNNYQAVSRILHYTDEKIVNMVDQNNKKISRTALIWGVNSNNYDIVTILLNKGADITFLADDSKSSALQFAAAHGNHGILDKLIRAGADITLVDNTGFNPLYTALFYGKRSAVKVLVAAYEKLYENEDDHQALWNLLKDAHEFGVSQDKCDKYCYRILKDSYRKLEENSPHVNFAKNYEMENRSSDLLVELLGSPTMETAVVTESLVNPFVDEVVTESATREDADPASYRMTSAFRFMGLNFGNL